MTIIKEIPFIQTYKELNVLIQRQIKDKQDQINELEREINSLKQVMTRNTNNITDLLGYECVLTSDDSEKPIASQSLSDGNMCRSNQSDDVDNTGVPKRQKKHQHKVHQPRKRRVVCKYCNKEMLRYSLGKHIRQNCKLKDLQINE